MCCSDKLQLAWAICHAGCRSSCIVSERDLSDGSGSIARNSKKGSKLTVHLQSGVSAWLEPGKLWEGGRRDQVGGGGGEAAKWRSTCKVARLLGLCLLSHGLLPDDWVGCLPHRGLARPQGIQRHLLAACIMQSPHAVDATHLLPGRAFCAEQYATEFRHA